MRAIVLHWTERVHRSMVHRWISLTVLIHCYVHSSTITQWFNRTWSWSLNWFQFNYFRASGIVSFTEHSWRQSRSDFFDTLWGWRSDYSWGLQDFSALENLLPQSSSVLVWNKQEQIQILHFLQESANYKMAWRENWYLIFPTVGKRHCSLVIRFGSVSFNDATWLRRFHRHGLCTISLAIGSTITCSYRLPIFIFRFWWNLHTSS